MLNHIVNTELYIQNCKLKRPRSISTHGVVFQKQFCKRDSVIRQRRTSIIYLRPRSPGACSNLPIPVPVGSGRAALYGMTSMPIRNLFGLAAHEVYPPGMSPCRDVSSYLTFSPLPRLRRGGYFLWHLLFRQWRTFLLGSMAPCAVPTFLTTRYRVAR